jgi:hypothetical protein
MGSLVPLARATEVVQRARLAPSPAPRQLDLVLDDIRLQGMTAAERHVALNALAQLLLDARGAVTTEAGDDDA